MALAGGDFCGWGAKQGSRVRSWKNRYFVLRGRELAYYGGAARDGSGVGEKGRLTVTGVEFAADLTHGLLVRGTKRGQVLRMTMSDAGQSRALFLAIRAALGEAPSSFRASGPQRLGLGLDVLPPPRKKSAPSCELPPPAQSSSATGAVGVTREGWLLKEEPELQTWKRRYVTLSGNVLTYYAGPTAMALESDVVQEVARDANNPRVVRVVAYGGRAVRLSSDSVADMDAWVAAIARATGKQLPALTAVERSWEEDAMRESDGWEREATCHIEEETASRRRRQSCEGWLDKRGRSSGAWKPRYFSLSDGLLEYRKSQSGDVCAENLVVDVAYSDENPEWMVVTFASDSDDDDHGMCMRASSTEETRRWMLALCDLVGRPAPESPTCHGQRTSSSASSASTSLALSASPPYVTAALAPSPAPVRSSDAQSYVQAMAPPPATQRVSMSKPGNEDGRASQQGVIYRGWLLKKGQRFKTWKRRYFVLTRTTLVYYRSSNVKGAILGSGVVFDVAVGKERPFSLDVRFRNGRQLHIVAPTHEIFSMWHRALCVSSELTESFINSKRGGEELLPVADEFDLDTEEPENGERDAEFTAADIEEYQSQLGTGAKLWVAAMQGVPLSERKYSWSSQVGGNEPDPAVDPDAGVAASEASVGGDPASQDQVLECQGWLMVEGDKLKSLQRRYCTLFGSKLSCYKGERSPLLQSLNVVSVSDWESVPFAMRVAGEGGVELIVSAQSNQDYQKWWRALSASALETTGRTTSGLQRSESAGRRTSSSGEKRLLACSGWLEKEGRRFRTWKQRYFEFRNGALIYYSDVDGAVLGHGVVVHAEVDAYKYNTLTVELLHGRTMRVTAVDKDDMMRWLGALNKSRTVSSAGTASLSDASDVPADAVLGVDEEGGGRLSAPVDGKRMDSSDYFANDTSVTDETYRRIMSFEDNLSLIGTMNEAERSFRGELVFGDRVNGTSGLRTGEVEDACDDEEDEGEVMDTANSVEYFRALVDEDALAKERRLAAEDARASGMPPVNSCTGGCCIVM